ETIRREKYLANPALRGLAQPSPFFPQRLQFMPVFFELQKLFFQFSDMTVRLFQFRAAHVERTLQSAQPSVDFGHGVRVERIGTGRRRRDIILVEASCRQISPAAPLGTPPAPQCSTLSFTFFIAPAQPLSPCCR